MPHHDANLNVYVEEEQTYSSTLPQINQSYEGFTAITYKSPCNLNNYNFKN